MTEQERFTITICDNYRHILKDRDSTLSITLRGVCHKEELALLDTLNNLHKENEKLKKENEVIKEEYKHHLSELQGENEILTKENKKLKDNLKEIGYEFKKYSYEETGKKIEDYNTEKLLTSLLQDIINELQDGWFVAEFESDFSNEVDINTLRTYAKNFCMKVSLRRTKPRKLFF